MSSKEVTVSRAEANDPREALKAQVEAEFAAALEKKVTLQVAVTPPGLPFAWNVWARGPYQLPGFQPGRILRVNQTAWIATVVWMNPLMCATVEAFEADILLNFWTSNTQTMQPVPTLAHQACVEPGPVFPWGCFNTYVWEFTPPVEACLLETNICARLCNCDGRTVPGYAGFVRWVQNFDPEVLWPAPPIEFDNPIRYMVYAPDAECKCP